MAEPVQILSQNLLVSGVGRVNVTVPAQSEDDGLWYREVQFYHVVESGNDVLLLSVRMSGETQLALNITAPAQLF